MTRLFSRFSVRTKLFVSSLLVTLIAMTAVGRSDNPAIFNPAAKPPSTV